MNNDSLQLEPKKENNESDDENDDVFVREYEKCTNNDELSNSYDQFDKDETGTECAKSKNFDNNIENSNERKNIDGASLPLKKDERNSENKSIHVKVEKRKKITTALIIMYMTLQFFLPFSHFITKVRK